MKNFQPIFHTLKVTIVFAFVLFFTSCEKEGEEGPAGPAGKDGAANVTTDTYSFTNSDWNFTPFINAYEAVIDVPQITQDVIENGTIQVFMIVQGYYFALPYVVSNSQINYAYVEGEVSIFFSKSDGMPNNPGAMTVKLVIIPPANLVKGVDHKNYKTLEAIYELE